MKYEIEVVPVYRIKGTNKTYRTYAAVVNHMSWNIVFDKYGDRYEWTDNGFVDIVETFTTNPKRYVCDCNKHKLDAYGYEPVPEYVRCPVHDRETGYLRRLHDRLVRFLLVRYPMPRLATMEIES